MVAFAFAAYAAIVAVAIVAFLAVSLVKRAKPQVAETYELREDDYCADCYTKLDANGKCPLDPWDCAVQADEIEARR